MYLHSTQKVNGKEVDETPQGSNFNRLKDGSVVREKDNFIRKEKAQESDRSLHWKTGC